MGPDIPVLETPRLRLRGHRLSDFDASAAMWADEAVVRHILGRPSSHEESWSRFLRYVGHWVTLGFGYWLVETRAGDFVGEVGFADYRRAIDPPQTGLPEAGWVLCRAMQGQGLATEAVGRMHDWASGRREFGRTFCFIEPAHEASIRVAQKAGYGAPVSGTYDGQPALLMFRG